MPRPVVTLVLLALVACGGRGSTRASTTAAPSPSAMEQVVFTETRIGITLSGATAEHGIRYAPVSPAQTLDLFLPLHGAKPYPVVVRIHGGGFRSGSARTEAQGPAAERIVAAGYALAAINYRLAPEAAFPAGARDAKAAVRFLRANAARWNLDAGRMAAWGEAAGGWFAVMLGVTGDQSTLFDDDSLGNAQVSSAVHAVVDWYGPTSFARMDAQNAEHPSVACKDTYGRHSLAGTAESTWLCGDRVTPLTDTICAAAARDADLIGYVATARVLPAFTIAHGGDDCETPWWQSVELHEALRKRESSAIFTKVSRAVHGDPQIEVAGTPRALEMLGKVFHPTPGGDESAAR